jgi:hypothetical protein
LAGEKECGFGGQFPIISGQRSWNRDSASHGKTGDSVVGRLKGAIGSEIPWRGYAAILEACVLPVRQNTSKFECAAARALTSIVLIYVNDIKQS